MNELRKDWTDTELERLENSEDWDWDTAEVYPPIKDGATLVTATFTRADFAEVATEAERLGIGVARFVREAALMQARAKHVRKVTMAGNRTDRERLSGDPFLLALLSTPEGETPLRPDEIAGVLEARQEIAEGKSRQFTNMRDAIQWLNHGPAPE